MTSLRPPPVVLAALTMLLASFVPHIAYADGFDLARLMLLLSLAPEAEVSYTEKKYSSLLAEPMASSGTLVYRRPDTVEKNMMTPRKERFRIVGDQLIVVRSGAEKRFPLSAQPLLAAFAASLRGVLAGDAALLRSHYRLALAGEEQAWRLEMIPLEQETARYIERILVSGRAGGIEQIEVRERGGDRSVMQLR